MNGDDDIIRAGDLVEFVDQSVVEVLEMAGVRIQPAYRVESLSEGVNQVGESGTWAKLEGIDSVLGISLMGFHISALRKIKNNGLKKASKQVNWDRAPVSGGTAWAP
jgi:hypothetical protein